MTVIQLIDKLHSLDPTLPVLVEVGYENPRMIHDDVDLVEVREDVWNPYDGDGVTHPRAVVLV